MKGLYHLALLFPPGPWNEDRSDSLQMYLFFLTLWFIIALSYTVVMPLVHRHSMLRMAYQLREKQPWPGSAHLHTKTRPSVTRVMNIIWSCICYLTVFTLGWLFSDSPSTSPYLARSRSSAVPGTASIRRVPFSPRCRFCSLIEYMHASGPNIRGGRCCMLESGTMVGNLCTPKFTALLDHIWISTPRYGYVFCRPY